MGSRGVSEVLPY